MQPRDDAAKSEPASRSSVPESTREAARSAASLVRALADAGLRISTAESCTAGLLSSLLASAPGASIVLRAGYIAYSKDAKADVLGVPALLMAGRHGAVTTEVAQVMASHARLGSGADVAVSVTGVAGPSGDEDGNVVGRMEIACDWGEGRSARSLALEPGERDVLSAQAAIAAFQLVMEALALLEPVRDRRLEGDH